MSMLSPQFACTQLHSLQCSDDSLWKSPLSLSQSPKRSQPLNPRLSADATSLPTANFPTLGQLGEELDAIVASYKLHTLVSKDFSFLLRPEIYHPLSLLDIPPTFRSSFYNPAIGEPLETSLQALNTQLTQGHFLLAAHLSAKLLTSPILQSSDAGVIFMLLYTRLACLELTGNSSFAAQESKALEDLNSTFYYVDIDLKADNSTHDPRRGLYHIVPWPLRVLAVRLQSIAFGDSRKTITGLYELAFEARREFMRPTQEVAIKQVWRERLHDLGTRIANALIEMGDLDAAKRSLMNLRGQADTRTEARSVLLALRIGDLSLAKHILDKSPVLNEGILRPLTTMAEGSYEDAAAQWKLLLGESSESLQPIIVQNLAVCLLYTGCLNEVIPDSRMSTNNN